MSEVYFHIYSSFKYSTIETGKAHYWSTSRNKLWLKGESSGHFQEVKEILVDCDMDAIILKIEQTGAACHEGYRSCFFRKLKTGTPARIDGRTLDYSKLELHPGDEIIDGMPRFFSYKPNRPIREQYPCYLTKTNEKSNKSDGEIHRFLYKQTEHFFHA